MFYDSYDQARLDAEFYKLRHIDERVFVYQCQYELETGKVTFKYKPFDPPSPEIG